MIFEIHAETFDGSVAESKYRSFIKSLTLLGGNWGLAPDSVIPPLDFKKESVAFINWNKLFKKIVRYSLFFRYRNMLYDHHACDDRVYVEFNTPKVDYEELIYSVFEFYVKEFDGYFASIFPEELIYEDFDLTRNKNVRKYVHRFCPVMFVSNKLCQKAFGVSVEQLAKVLSGHVEKVWYFNDGIGYIHSAKVLTPEACNTFDQAIKNRLVEIRG